ncbi:helix-turn-helix domain-containing protein [Deinococcus hopiensis]|uniref:helix-turn-helix domain-containing protein n=1 Tax=Deinococcus hopiensis TaxID=309885 RepID=UPI000A01373F|nr:winged helix-turn-helix domain-containing protein [Deinococcus hopiensis]
MARPARRIEISEEDDARLRELELSPHTHPKARLRASILRLHRAGWSIPQLSKHFDRNHQAIHNDLTRFEEDGMSGLTDGCAPGRRSAVTPEVEQFLHEKLQEQRFWNAPLLCEEIERQLQIVIRPRALGNHLQRLGYSWKRARDSPAKKLDPEGVQQHQRALETLKKGHWTAD